MKIAIETAITHQLTINLTDTEAKVLREAVHECLAFKTHKNTVASILAEIEEALDNR